jgi:hypothetical protein
VKIQPVLLALLIGTASGGVAATTSVVIWTGSAAKGGSSTNTTFSSLGVPSINASGKIAFSGSVTEVFSWPIMMPLQAQASSVTGIKTLPPIPAPTPIQPKITNVWSGIWSIDSKGSNAMIARIGAPFMIVDAGGFGSLSDPILNSAGTIAWAGTYYAGFIMPPPVLIGAPVTNFYSGAGIWTSSNSYQPVAFVGETAPGYSNPYTTSVGILSDIANQQSTNGFLLSNTPVTFTNWVSFTSIDRVVLPDTGKAIFSATVGTSNYYYPPVPTNPPYITPLYVAAEPLTQHGIWAQSGSGSLSPISLEGEVLHLEGSNRTVETISFLTCTNEAGGQSRSFNQRTGDIVYSATFTDGNQALILESSAHPGRKPILLTATGDAAPGGNSNTTFASFGDPALNAANHIAFRATTSWITPFPIVYAAASSTAPLISSPDLFTNSWDGIWADDARGNLNMIARTAPPVPDQGGFSSFSDPVFNSAHKVAFIANWRRGFISVAPGKFAGEQGIWTSSNLTNPVAWIGQTAPGYPKPLTATIVSPYPWSTNIITYSSIAPVFSSFERIALPDTGRVVIWGKASATNLIPRPPVPKGIVVTQEMRSGVLNQRGIWIQNTQGGLDLIVREGGTLVVNGKSRVISSLATASADGPTGSQSRSFNQTTGTLVYMATFTDGTQAIVKVTP